MLMIVHFMLILINHSLLEMVVYFWKYADLKFSVHTCFCSNLVCLCALMKMNNGLCMHDARGSHYHAHFWLLDISIFLSSWKGWYLLLCCNPNSAQKFHLFCLCCCWLMWHGDDVAWPCLMLNTCCSCLMIDWWMLVMMLLLLLHEP